MIDTKKYKIFYCFPPFGLDEDSDKFKFIWPKFSLKILKNKPCTTHWFYDWILDIGWIYIFRKSIYYKDYRQLA